MNIIPVILCGGGGTRLFPLSRAQYPKQFIAFDGGGLSLLQKTLQRVAHCQHIIVIGNQNHRFLVAEQIQQLGLLEKTTILLEPMVRDSAGAIMAVCIYAMRHFAGAGLLFMASDHIIEKTQQFQHDITIIQELLNNNAIALFGLKPDHPATQYGYIAPNTAKPVAGGFVVKQFVEKPNLATAQQYCDNGYLWNSGYFCFDPKPICTFFNKQYPNDFKLLQSAVDSCRENGDFIWLGDEFAHITPISFDYAVVEKYPHNAVLPVDWGWNDIGSFGALKLTIPPDTQNNATQGQVLLHNSHNMHIQSGNDILTIAVGLNNCHIIVHDGVVLCIHNDHLGEMKAVVNQLKQVNHPSLQDHYKIYRPWGYYQTIERGPNYQVKKLHIKIGAQISLQRHQHRAEHWVVVGGVAGVHLNGVEKIYHENESVYIAPTAIHRLKNMGDTPLEIIEVQTGHILSEEDIERFTDDYGRV